MWGGVGVYVCERGMYMCKNMSAYDYNSVYECGGMFGGAIFFFDNL